MIDVFAPQAVDPRLLPKRSPDQELLLPTDITEVTFGPLFGRVSVVPTGAQIPILCVYGDVGIAQSIQAKRSESFPHCITVTAPLPLEVGGTVDKTTTDNMKVAVDDENQHVSIDGRRLDSRRAIHVVLYLPRQLAVSTQRLLGPLDIYEGFQGKLRLAAASFPVKAVEASWLQVIDASDIDVGSVLHDFALNGSSSCLVRVGTVGGDTRIYCATNTRVSVGKVAGDATVWTNVDGEVDLAAVRGELAVFSKQRGHCKIAGGHTERLNLELGRMTTFEHKGTVGEVTKFKRGWGSKATVGGRPTSELIRSRQAPPRHTGSERRGSRADRRGGDSGSWIGDFFEGLFDFLRFWD